ncbi:MAG: NTP transferase domain-containing protein [Patescibacteria group bacterium]
MSFRFVILAAGKGTRMKMEKPKVLAKVGDLPMIGHIFSNLHDLFLQKPTVIVGYKGEEVIEFLKQKAEFVWQKEQLGTGHALLCARDFLKDFHGDLVVLNGDQPLWQKETLQNLIQKHKENKADVSFVSAYLNDFDDWRQGFNFFGRILRDEKGVFQEIKEYKDANEEQRKVLEVNAGCYCFNADWLWKNIKRIKNENSQKEFYLTDILQIAKQSGAVIETLCAPAKEIIGANTLDELKILEKFIV